MSIGERLREEREKIGYSQQKLSAIGGVQKRAQIHYESGERQPDAAYLRGIAQVGIDLQYVLIGLRSANLMDAMLSDEFVEETSTERSISRSDALAQAAEEHQLLLAFRRCPPDGRALLLKTASLLSPNFSAATPPVSEADSLGSKSRDAKPTSKSVTKAKVSKSFFGVSIGKVVSKKKPD